MKETIRTHLLAFLILGWTGLSNAQSLPWPETVAKDAELVEVYSNDKFFEGPSWDARSGKLFFTAFSPTNQQILRLDSPGRATVWMNHAGAMNGTYISNDGRLIVTQAGGHRIVSYGFGQDGPTDVKTLLLDPTLHQPNDLCQLPRGDIFFTDPDFNEKKTSAVYHLSSQGRLKKVITDLAVPNGIIASPRGKTLYVADSHAKAWYAYPLYRSGGVGPGRVFFKPESEVRGAPDGMTVDEDGNLYLTGMGGIWVVSGKSKLLGFVAVPELCSNATFGGPNGKTLYITCSKKVYSLEMDVKGVPFGRRIWQLFRSAD